jgi:hypothetical protein
MQHMRRFPITLGFEFEFEFESEFDTGTEPYLISFKEENLRESAGFREL